MSFARPVAPSTRSYDIAAAVGQTVFTFPDPLFDTADLLVSVQVANGPFLPVLPGVCTVALTAALDEGTVTFAVPPCTVLGPAVVVRLQGARVQSRLSDVTRGGTLNSRALEDELDRQAIILQEVRRDVSAALAQAVALAASALPLGPGVRRGAFLAALNALVPNALGDLQTAIPGDPGNAVTLAWADATVAAGGPLATFVQARYGLTAAQMIALFAAAAFF